MTRSVSSYKIRGNLTSVWNVFMDKAKDQNASSRIPIMFKRISYNSTNQIISARDKSISNNGPANIGSEYSQFDNSQLIGGVYVISVAARILDTHPQTLRKYERLGLISPSRSIGMLRLYSTEDVIRVRLIKYMVDTLGMNLAGVEFALNILNQLINLREKLNIIAESEDVNRSTFSSLMSLIEEIDDILPQKI